MGQTINSIRGMHDILPADIGAWHLLEDTIRQTMPSYGYNEIRTPIVEKTDLFCRSIGEVTDIVEKEMYTFPDRNGDSLSLRPENTASCVRAGIEHGLLHNSIQKLWYMGPMFRHERPQKGRYRQFHQFGAEVFGVSGPSIEAELILLSARLWKSLGINDLLKLEINTLGDTEDRTRYRDGLVQYFERYKEDLDQESLSRLERNPLRILDSKNPNMQEMIEGAPSLIDMVSDGSRSHFDLLQEVLAKNGITYTLNSRLVRGLDYYSHTVFEWVSTALGAQGTACAGGRYDGLVPQLGGRPSPGAGWASGVERVLLLIEHARGKIHSPAPHAYLVVGGQKSNIAGALAIAERLHDDAHGFRLDTDCTGGSVKAQFKRADKSGAKIAIVIGEEEIAQDSVSIKFLREDKPQETVAVQDASSTLKALFGL
ncbi:MAG: histidine--tRNA ligase [Pseudomonadota bacterium]